MAAAADNREPDQRREVGKRSHRSATWLAWSTCALSLVLISLSFLLLMLTWSQVGVHVFDYWVENAMVAVVCSAVGAVVTSRRPDHRIGWLFCAIGLIGAARPLAAEYATYALLVQPSRPSGGAVLAWISAWMWFPHLGLMVYLGLLFPNGRLPSARWRPFAWFVVIAVSAGTLATAFSPGVLPGLAPIENPFGFEGLKRLGDQARALVWALAVVATISLFARLRRARGIERQQLKWFAYAAGVATIGGVLTYVGGPEATGVLWVRWVGLLVIVVGFSGIPIAIGIAILRYRLYDIDLIVNRTLVYGVLTVVLAGIFQAIDATLHYLLITLTHQHSLPGSVIAALVVGALFHPIRSRIQHFVDRHVPSEVGGTQGKSEELNPPRP